MARVLAWLGGALFVASLALTAWWYFVELGHPVAAGHANGTAAWLWNTALIILFGGHHSLFAREWVKRRLTVIPPHMLRSFYVSIASVLLILVVALWRPIGGELFDNRGALGALHALVVIIGFYVTARAVGVLDPLDLAGIRQALHQPLQSQGLRTDGVYGFVRHPLYLGWMLAFFGVAHMTTDRFLFAVLTSAYLVIAVPWEERSLRETFGNAYQTYASRVRWRIVPFIY